MKVNSYTKTGNKSEKKIELSDSVFKVPMNKDLVAQVVYVYLNNQRKHTANVKTRGDVSGGGKKPWKQKHTGRARQGSIRSPLWVGGGVAFGPTEYKKTLKVSKKMRDLSLKCLLSDKVKNEDILVINDVEVDKKTKTKNMSDFLDNLGVLGSKVLFVYESELKNKDLLKRSFRNLPRTVVIDSKNVCTFDVMNAAKLVVSEKAVKEFEERLK